MVLAGSVVALMGCSKESARTPPAGPPPLAIAGHPEARAAGVPGLEVVNGDGQLGVADFGERRECRFTLRNNTAAAVRLQATEKSCTCAGARLEPEVVEAGKTCTVTLVWAPKAEVLETTTSRLWTEIRAASGTATVRLEATGTLEPRVRFAFPRGPLDFGRLDLSDVENPGKVLVVEAYSSRGPFRVETLQSTLEGIQVAPAEPMSPDRLAALQARAGYRISLQPTRKLPGGQFFGRLLLTTNVSPQPLDLPVTGRFDTGIVSLSAERIELPPRLSLRQGYRAAAITLTVRQGTCSTCTVVNVAPKLFRAKVTRLDDKTWRIELALPEGLDAAKAGMTVDQWKELSEFGFEQGQLTLQLDHPELKALQIPINGAQLVP